jgi:hypothetical protein
MNEQSKTAAIKELRREVGFGCPICRLPFLTWHHFDPPWHEEGHWRSEGIVAMCPLCHADADEKGESAGAYSKEELRALKRTYRSSEDVKGHFPSWQDKEQLLVRVGGVYCDTLSPAISINGIPQIRVGKNEAGLLSLSFELRNRHDDVLVKMEDNWFTAYPPNVHDMIVTPKTKAVKVWLSEEDVGLVFSFRRLTISELEEMLGKDKRRADKIVAKYEHEWLARLPLESRRFMEAIMQDLRSARRESPDGSTVVHFSYDLVGDAVRRWVQENCVMDDGLIPVLNFDEMALYFHGTRIKIKDGIANCIDYSACFNNGKGAAVNIEVSATTPTQG